MQVIDEAPNEWNKSVDLILFARPFPWDQGTTRRNPHDARRGTDELRP